ncbi:HYC_CC_PP family protein [Schleiferia thermophila]|uniref:Uncharacterized protein n=1 Tax=Schleiferia thermophila TaxID=884107 RepID=A0A369AAJ2_9FLAO|nr:hypothetical protein [Schleiferia thermophila]RCX05418.1 hypothetical protein DES35_101703 [Schleiferia thermophila]
MKSLLHKLTAQLMVFFLLLSGSGVHFSVHVCMGEITDISLFQPADGCCTPEDSGPLDCHEVPSDTDTCEKESCCVTEIVSLASAHQTLILEKLSNINFFTSPEFAGSFTKYNKNTTSEAKVIAYQIPLGKVPLFVLFHRLTYYG